MSHALKGSPGFSVKYGVPEAAVAIDRRQQHQIPARIVYFSAADGYAEQIVVKLDAVVKHEAEKILLRTLRGICVTTYPSPVLASEIAGE